MKKLFTALFIATVTVFSFQNCAKQLESQIGGFVLVDKFTIGNAAQILGESYEEEAGAAVSSMMWSPPLSQIELKLESGQIKKSDFKLVNGYPEPASEVTCDVSEDRIYQSLKGLISKQEICKYESTVKAEERNWSACPVYMMTHADTFSFSVFVPETAGRAAVRVGFDTDKDYLQNADPNCITEIQVFCGPNQGEVLDQLIKELVDRFDTYTNCTNTSIASK